MKASIYLDLASNIFHTECWRMILSKLLGMSAKEEGRVEGVQKIAGKIRCRRRHAFADDP